MPAVRGIVVSVDYSAELQITLERNMRFMGECVVVTSPRDAKTTAVAGSVPNVRICHTDAFWRHNASFNKGAALEEGFSVLGRHEWILIWDADTLFPDNLDLTQIVPGNLYGATRRCLLNQDEWTPDFDWKRALPTREKDVAGHFQLFSADDPCIATRPWYDVTFTHAGGGDGYFASRWPRERKSKPFEVLHLGRPGRNWFGRDNQKLMDEYCASKGFGRHPSGKAFNEHVNVPGVLPTGFKLPGIKADGKAEERAIRVVDCSDGSCPRDRSRM